MRAYRRIGGHSWSQPIMELLHKQGRGIPLTLMAAGKRGTWGEWRGMYSKGRATCHVSRSAVCVGSEEETETKIRGRDQMANLFSVQQCQQEVTSLRSNPQICSCSCLHPSSSSSFVFFIFIFFYYCLFFSLFCVFPKSSLTFVPLSLPQVFLRYHRIRCCTAVTQHPQLSRFLIRGKRAWSCATGSTVLRWLTRSRKSITSAKTVF